jgi:pyrroloquinoline-quinone synthase
MEMRGEAWSCQEFEARLRAKGTAYHDHHPFNLRLNGGNCSRDQIRGWVANQFYYEISLPLKDSAILSNCPDLETRRRWVLRILDYDGYDDHPGRLDAWSCLADAVGLAREELWTFERVAPGVRFAVDAYVNFARRAPWQESVCSSLPELFALQAQRDRLVSWPEQYPWIESGALAAFRSRVSPAQDHLDHGLEVILGHFTLRDEQERALDILQFKLDVLWNMLDSIDRAFLR